MRFVGRLYRVWWARPAAFLPFRDAAARLYEETSAAGVLLSDTGTAPCLEHQVRQLVQYAKYGKATLYGKRTTTGIMEPIGRNDLWSGRRADGMSSWIAGNGAKYTELSLRRHDLARIIQLVKQGLKDHDALLAWCHRHASSNGS